ncbi:MAG: undecaprenyl-diphosphate phosphatase [Cytophagaceae bacterium]
MSILEAIILAIVEGVTEFLPISSTGHMIIVSSMMGIADKPIVKIFEISIQFGAILSVIILYYKRFLQSVDFYKKLLIAFIPAAIFGKLLDDYIDQLLERVEVVGITLLAGGIVLLFIDKWFAKNETAPENEITNKKALMIGLCQCIAMIPGVSRSAATIIGGLTQKLNRKTAAEFSFFLAVPTMFAASAYKLLKNYKYIQQEDITVLVVGNIVAFIVAMLAIKFFISFLTKYGFRLFGYYRIALGIIILALVAYGYDLKIAD